MAPSLTDTTPVVPVVDGKSSNKALQREPLRLKGSLDAFESFEVTPIIGREYPTANLKDILRAPNSDDLLRDLAITVSRRGVVFFRKQDDLDNGLQKELVQRLGELSGKPSTSGLHVHPIINSGREHGVKDDEISVISSAERQKLYRDRNETKRQSARREWHSDITFEPIPSDYTILRLTQLPETGGGRFPVLILFGKPADSESDRHSLGLGLRDLRPTLPSVSEIPRVSHGNLRPARVQPNRQRECL